MKNSRKSNELFLRYLKIDRWTDQRGWLPSTRSSERGVQRWELMHLFKAKCPNFETKNSSSDHESLIFTKSFLINTSKIDVTMHILFEALIKKTYTINPEIYSTLCAARNAGAPRNAGAFFFPYKKFWLKEEWKIVVNYVLR